MSESDTFVSATEALQGIIGNVQYAKRKIGLSEDARQILKELGSSAEYYRNSFLEKNVRRIEEGIKAHAAEHEEHGGIWVKTFNDMHISKQKPCTSIIVDCGNSVFRIEPDSVMGFKVTALGEASKCVSGPVEEERSVRVTAIEPGINDVN